MKPGQKITGVGGNQLSYRYPFSSSNKLFLLPSNNTYYSTLQSGGIIMRSIRHVRRLYVPSRPVLLSNNSLKVGNSTDPEFNDSLSSRFLFSSVPYFCWMPSADNTE